MFFICIYNGPQAILEKCRQQLGKCVNHRGLTEFVGALFSLTICDHPLKSLLIWFTAGVCFLRFLASLRALPAFWLVSWGCPPFAKRKQSAKWSDTADQAWKCKNLLRQKWRNQEQHSLDVLAFDMHFLQILSREKLMFCFMCAFLLQT